MIKAKKFPGTLDFDFWIMKKGPKWYDNKRQVGIHTIINSRVDEPSYRWKAGSTIQLWRMFDRRGLTTEQRLKHMDACPADPRRAIKRLKWGSRILAARQNQIDQLINTAGIW